jgi:VIT1/CCC1 family predicted Fe2+/Mn2+ transporter
MSESLNRETGVMSDGEGEKRARVLDPVDRVSEVIFGLLMAMTFIGSLSVATAGREEVRTMMITAFGCNLAWGLADAVMYLVRTATARTRSRTMAARLRSAKDAVEGQSIVSELLPPSIAATLGSDGLEVLRQRLAVLPTSQRRAPLRGEDFVGAVGIFALVVFATFPVVVPFMIFDQAALAVRVSNGVALAMLFISGCVLARYSGGRPWHSGFALALTGAALMAAIMALGG